MAIYEFGFWNPSKPQILKFEVPTQSNKKKVDGEDTEHVTGKKGKRVMGKG